MKPLTEFSVPDRRAIRGVFADIDETLTTDGRLTAGAYSAVHMEAEGEVDQRGSRGVQGVRLYFNGVRLTIRFTSVESPERLDKLAKNVNTTAPS